MIGLMLGIVILCAIVYILFALLPVPANIQKAIWIVVAIVALLWIANYFGYVPDHFGARAHTA